MRLVEPATRDGMCGKITVVQMAKLAAIEVLTMRLPASDPSNRPDSRTRLSLRKAIVIVAPSVIVIVGVWLGSVAGLMLVNDPFESGLVVMSGGSAVAVTAALVVSLLINRRSGRDVSAVRDTAECHAKSPFYERGTC